MKLFRPRYADAPPDHTQQRSRPDHWPGTDHTPSLSWLFTSAARPLGELTLARLYIKPGGTTTAPPDRQVTQSLAITTNPSS